MANESTEQVSGGAGECASLHGEGGSAPSQPRPHRAAPGAPAPCPGLSLSSAAPAAGPRRGLARRPSPPAAAPSAGSGSCCAAGAPLPGPPTAV